MLALEKHSWHSAIEVWILVDLVVVAQLNEILHVELQGGERQVFGVVLVEPGAGWFVAFLSDDNITVIPRRVAFSSHVP